MAKSVLEPALSLSSGQKVDSLLIESGVLFGAGEFSLSLLVWVELSGEVLPSQGDDSVCWLRTMDIGGWANSCWMPLGVGCDAAVVEAFGCTSLLRPIRLVEIK